MVKNTAFTGAGYRQVGEPIACNNEFSIIIMAKDRKAAEWERRSAGITDRTYSLWLEKAPHPALRTAIDQEFSQLAARNDKHVQLGGAILIGEVDTAPDKQGKFHREALKDGVARAMHLDFGVGFSLDTQDKIRRSIETDLLQIRAVSSNSPFI